MLYKIYQVYELGLHKLIELKEKKDVSNTHCVLPSGKIFNIERNTMVNNKYFEIELINLK